MIEGLFLLVLGSMVAYELFKACGFRLLLIAVLHQLGNDIIRG